MQLILDKKTEARIKTTAERKGKDTAPWLNEFIRNGLDLLEHTEMRLAAASRENTLRTLDRILNELLSNHETPMPEDYFLACNAVEAAKNAINSGRSAELLGLLQGSGFVPTGLED